MRVYFLDVYTELFTDCGVLRSERITNTQKNKLVVESKRYVKEAKHEGYPIRCVLNAADFDKMTPSRLMKLLKSEDIWDVIQTIELERTTYFPT